MTSLTIRLVTLDDAEYIYKSRHSNRARKWLNTGTSDYASHVDWVKSYLVRQADGIEFYFIIEFAKKRHGFFRLYNLNSLERRIEFGSFYLNSDRPKFSASIVLEFSKMLAWDLGFNEIFLVVNKNNIAAKIVYLRSGFKPVQSEDNQILMTYKME